MTLIKFTALLLLLAAYSTAAAAEVNSYYATIKDAPIDEVWVNPGFYSRHFQLDKNLNDNNLGLGIEYRYSTIYAVTAGRFNNSDRETSSYAAFLAQPIVLGGIRLGAVLGVINGYSRVNHGNWFPLIIPVASYEYKYVGINLTYIPTIQDTIYGAITLQLKFKIY